MLHKCQKCDVTEFGIWLVDYLMPSSLRITAITRLIVRFLLKIVQSIVTNDLDEIKLSWHFEGGLPGIDDDPDNPLSRAARSPLVDGRPQLNLSLCFYNDAEESRAEGKLNLRWFGAFILSSRGRLIFFPGFNFNPTWVEVARELHHKRYGIQIDHITLEKNHDHWHYTSPGSEHHLGSGLTTDLDRNRFLWFGLSIADSSVLRPVRQETVFHTKVPSSDSKRPANVFMTSRERAVFNIISPHQDAKKRFNTGFLHFGLIIGPPGFPEYSGPNFGIPFGSPFLNEALTSPLINIPMRLHRISIGSTVDIEIVVLWLPGSLKEKVTFTSPSTM